MSFILLQGLYETLDERGHKEAARAVLRDLRPLLHRHFPEPLHRILDRYSSAYGDLVALSRTTPGTARMDGDRTGGGGVSDPTGRQALHMARLDRIDIDCLEVYQRHLPSLEKPPRRRVRVWREAEEAANAYAERTIVEIREEYGA